MPRISFAPAILIVSLLAPTLLAAAESRPEETQPAMQTPAPGSLEGVI